MGHQYIGATGVKVHQIAHLSTRGTWEQCDCESVQLGVRRERTRANKGRLGEKERTMEQFDKTGVCRICRNIYHNTIHGHKCPEKERTMVFSLGNTDEILEGNREPAWKTSTTPLGSEIDRLRVENERLLKDLNDWKIKYIDLSYHHDTGPYEGCHCTTCKLIAENERLTRELAEAQKKLAYTIEQAADLALKLGSVMNHVHATDVSEFLASKNVYQELKESERQWEITASMLSEAEAARDTAQSDLVACRE